MIHDFCWADLEVEDVGGSVAVACSLTTIKRMTTSGNGLNRHDCVLQFNEEAETFDWKGKSPVKCVGAEP